jgi:uncharacterized protein YjiS (DUF1127 family)
MDQASGTHSSDLLGRSARHQSLASGAWVARLLDQILLWSDRARSRRLLAAFDDRTLSDIGVDRATAHHEAMKPFWR